MSSRQSSRVGNATLLARIDEVRQLCSQTPDVQAEILDLIQRQRTDSQKQAQMQMEGLDEVKEQLATLKRDHRATLEVFQGTVDSIVELKALLMSVSKTVIDLQISASTPVYARSLDPTRGLPVILEDALGRPFEIPAQWIENLQWEVRTFYDDHHQHDSRLFC